MGGGVKKLWFRQELSGRQFPVASTGSGMHLVVPVVLMFVLFILKSVRTILTAMGILNNKNSVNGSKEWIVYFN